MHHNKKIATASIEKRSQPRAAAKQKIAAFSPKSDEPVGQVANFHDEGFMLISGYPVAEGDPYRLRMEFAYPVAGRYSVTLGAECLWTREAAGNQVWAGFSITDIAEDDRHLLLALAGQLDQ